MIETEINWPKQINKILLILNEYFIFYSINMLNTDLYFLPF